MKKIFTILAVALVLSSCTQNSMVKQFGGTATYNLPKGQKLINCTWKDDNLWYLTRPMATSDSAVTYSFSEKNSMGLAEGTYIINESK